MTSMVPAGEGGGGGNDSTGGGGNTGTEQAPPNLAASPPQQPDSQQQQQQQQQHSQHPPPSPLSGCYLLVVLPEPHSAQHKDLILNRLAKGFLSWDKDSCHVDLEKELQALVVQAPEGEEARNGERLIQYATENLVTEVLIYPQSNTLLQCIRNLLASFTKHRHIIHAGYTFGGNGSWILQDGTFSLADFLDAFSEHEVQRVLRAYENSVTVDIHCASVGDWTTTRFSKEACTRACRVRVNPDDVLTAGVPAITNFTNYIGQYLIAQTLDQLMEPSDVVGNIRFSHPTLYVFPGGQGDAALFGINGFNMLVDGGFARKACFWDFARHLDRLDAVLVTRINNSNIGGMSSVLRKKKEMYVYPQIGHFFCNLVERRHSNSPDGDKDIDPLILDLIDIGQEMIVNLRHINLRPHPCYRDPEPINLYHKVGHGTLDMYVLSPSKDSREVREFLAKWNASDSKLFAGSHKKDSNSVIFPIQNLLSICAMLVWQPANPEDTITRILFPGSTPQHKIFEGFERLKHLEFLKHPVCTAKSLSPSTSLAALKDKSSILKPKLSSVERENKRLVEGRKEKRDSAEVKAVKKDPVIEDSAAKISTGKPVALAAPKSETKAKKVVENKKIESEVKESKKIEKELKETKVEVKKVERSEGSDVETKKTDVVKAETEKTVLAKDPKLHKAEIKKRDVKDTSKLSTKVSKVDSGIKPSAKSADKKSKVGGEKKDAVKSSPTTPKKSISSTTIKNEIPKTTTKSAVRITSKMTSSAPAKSTKDANNRKVVEQKNNELSSMATSSGSAAGAKAPAKAKAIERKPIPIGRRPKPVSPSKARLPISPVKSIRSTPKSEKDAVIRKVKGGTTDSSAVSTPTGIESETAIKLIDKNLTEKSEDMSLDSIESKVLADLKEEREVVEEIEAVLQKAERIEEARKEERFDGDDEITAEATDKKEEDVTEEDVTAEMDEIPKKISRKESQEFTEEDEYLIVEKEEIYTEDSMQSGDAEQKHHLDEAESEKIKEDRKHEGYSHAEEKEDADEKKDEVPEKKVADSFPEPKKSTDLSPEHKELLKEEMKQIIASAKEVVKKTEEKDDSGKRDSEDITKDPSSLSPDKLDSVKPEVEMKEVAIEKLEESQERISTLESGATTTAPTLPEDERIPLDEIKEDVDEKHAIEEVKEKDIIAKQKEDIPDTLPVVSKAEIKVLDVRPITQQGIIRDVVKTPDEVADLPVHEEVDPKLYRLDDLDKEKELKTTMLFQEQKEPAIVSTAATAAPVVTAAPIAPAAPAATVKETKDKGVFSFFGKVADKFEKGIDKLTKKARRDSSDKDAEDKSSKSSSPKEPKPQEKVSTSGITFEKVSPKLEKSVSIPLDSSAFLESQKKYSESNLVEHTTSPESKITLPEKDAVEDVEDIEEVEAFVEEASKKFRNVKDSLQDSLESLNEKVDELSKLPTDSKDSVRDTLSGAAEKLIDIKPDSGSVLEMKEPEKVTFVIPSSEELEEENEDSDGVIRDFKEAVRDVAEVLVGTAGIEIEKEEKPKDVVEIVKKVAEVLKTDDFLTDQSLDANNVVKTLNEDLMMPKKVGVTEELSVQEVIEEFIEKESIESSAKSYGKAEVFGIKEETYSKIDKSVIGKTPTEKEEAMRLCDDIMKSDIVEYVVDTEPDMKQDVMDLGLEEVCVKTIAKREIHDEKKEETIVQPEISFDQNLSPGKAEYVTVTPGSTPTSPKIPTEGQLADLPTEYTNIFNKNESLESLIEEFIVSKNHKITMQILEYIATIKRVPKDKIINIIHEIIIKCNISRENVADNIEVLRLSDNVSLEKRLEIENYIYNQYLNKNNKIILSTIEEISTKQMVPKHLVIEIIEEIIVKKHIKRESAYDIDKDKYLKLYEEGLQTPFEAGEEKALSLSTDEITDEKIVDGFVSIPSTETVKALQSHDESKIVDDFEAVEQEYKVSGVSSILPSEKSISEKDKQEITEDVSDVVEADEKFVKETFEKDLKEDRIADKEQAGKDLKDDEQKSIQNLEILETDTKEKYLDEDKEKTLGVAKTDVRETEVEEKDSGEVFDADATGHAEITDIHKSQTKETEYDMTQSLLKLSTAETTKDYDISDISPVESVISKSPIEKDVTTKKLEDLKTEEQQSNKLDKEELEELASTEKHVVQSETVKDEKKSKSPSEGKEITPEKIIDTGKLISVTDKSKDETKSISVEKEVHKIETLPDIKEISEDLKSEIDKTEGKSKSPSVEKEIHEVDISFDAKEIPKDLTLETDKFEHKSKSPSAEKEINHIDISSDIVEDGAKDVSKSPSAEKDVPKSETSIATGLSKDLKSATDKLEEKTKSSSIKEEVHDTDISSEVVADSKDLQSVVDKTKDASKSPSVEREDEKPEIISAKQASDMKKEKSDIKEISTLSEKIMTEEAYLEFDKLEDKLITKRDSISSSLETKVDKADKFSEKVKPDEAIVVAIDAREDVSKSKSPSVEKEEIQVEKLKIAADEIGDRSKSPSLEKELDNTELSVTKTTVTQADDVLKSLDAVITEDLKEADTKLQDKSKSSSPEKQVETTDISLMATIKDSKAVTDKSEDKSRSPSAEKDEKVEDSEVKTDKPEHKSRSPSAEKDEEKAKDLEVKAGKPERKSRSPSAEKDAEKAKDSEAKADKPDDKSRSPSAEKDEEKAKDSEAKADKPDDKSRSPSAEKDEEKVKDSEAKADKPEDKSRSPSAEKDEEKAKDSEAKADKAEDKSRSPRAEKDEEKAKDSEAKADKPDDKSRSPSAEKDEEKVKDSEAKADKPEDKSRSPSAEKDEEKAKDSEAKADKPDDKSRSPSAEKDEEKAKDSEVKAGKPEEKSRSPSAEKDEEKAKDSEAKADKLEDKSRSPSAEKDEEKAKDSESKADKPDDKSRSPSVEKDKEKAKDLEAKPDKPEDKSRSPSAEKEEKTKDSEAKADKPEDKSRSPSAEKDEEKAKDSEVKADKPEDKSRSPSAEKDEEKAKDSEAKADKPEDKSRSPSAEKDEEKVKDSQAKADKPGDKSRSPSAEKEEEKTKESEGKADKPEDKSRSPSAEKEEEKTKESEGKADKPEDKSRSPSAEKEEERTKESEGKVDKPEDKLRSTSAEKYEEKAKDSEAKADKAEDKSRSPSAEKDEENAKDSQAKTDKPDDKSRSPSAEKDKEKVKDSEAKADKPEDKSRSPSAEKDEEKAKDSEAKADKPDDKSRSPSAEKDEEKAKDLEVKAGKPEEKSRPPSAEKDEEKVKDSEAKADKSDDKSRSPSAEKDDKKTEDTSKSKILLEDSKEDKDKSTDVITDKTETVIEKSDHKSKSPSIEKESVLTMSDSKVVSDKLDEKSKSPTPEKEEKKGDVEEISHKPEDRSKSPSVEKTLGASEDVADKSLLSDTKKVDDQKPDGQSKSLSLQKELTHTEILITKAVSLEESEETFDKLKDSSTSPSAGKNEEKAKDSEVVIEKTEGRSKSPSEEKQLGMSEDLAEQKIQLDSSKAVDQKTDDTSKSSSVEKEEAQKEVIAKPISLDDTKSVSDKSEDKSRSPSVEKDEGKSKNTEVVVAKAEDRSKSPSVEKELGTSQDATVKSESSETSKTVDQKTDGRSKSPSVEKEEAQREASVAKPVSLEATKSVSDKSEDKSRSPSAEKDEGKLKDTEVAGEKSKDRSKSPSVEKQLGTSEDSDVKLVSLETSNVLDQKTEDRSMAPSVEKEEAQKEVSLAKPISSEDMTSVSDKSVDKSRSPSAEKDEENAIDSEVVVEKAEGSSKSPSVENELRTSQDATATSMPLETSKSVHQKTDDRSKSPSVEKEDAQKETSLAKPESLEDTKSVSDKSGDKSRSPSAEKGKDKPEESEVPGEKSKDRSKSPSVEKQLTTSEDSAVKLVSLETSKADDQKTEDRSKSPSVEKEEAQKQISVTKPISLLESMAASEKSADKSRSPNAEKDEEKMKDSTEKEILTEESEVVSIKSEETAKSPSVERKLGTSEDSSDKSLLMEKADRESKSPSIEKEADKTETPLTKAISSEDMKAESGRSEDKSRSPSAEKDEKRKDLSKIGLQFEDSEVIVDTKEDKSKSPSIEKTIELSKDSTDKAMIPDKSETVTVTIDTGSKSFDLEKQTEKIENLFTTEVSKAVPDKSEDKSRSTSAEKDEKSKDSEVAVEKMEDRSKSPSMEKPLGTSEDPTVESITLETTKAGDQKTDDRSKSPSVEKEEAQKEISDTKPISFDESKTASDKPEDKSRSPSPEKDEGKRKGSQVTVEKSEDRSKSPSVEKEEAHKVISDTKSVSEKSEDKTRSPSIEKDEGKSKDTEVAGEKSKDRSKSPNVEKQLGTSEDSAVKLVSLETSKALDPKTEDRSKSPSVEKEVAQKEVSLAKPISSEDMKSVSDKLEDKSKSPSAEKDEGKTKDSEAKADKPEDKSRSPSAEKDEGKAKDSEVAVEKLEDILKSPSVEKQLGKSEDSSDKSLLLEKTDGGSKSPSIEIEVSKTEILLTKAMSDKSDDKSRSPSAEKDEKRKDSLVEEKNVGISEVSTEKSLLAEQEKPEILKPKDKIDSFIGHEDLLEIRAVESSKESIDLDEKIKSPSLSQVELLEKGDTFGSKSINLVDEKSLQDEFMERKSSVTSVGSHAEDKGKDRSRSHSVFETGDRTPSVRSRAASLYDDKLTEKLALLDLTKDSSSYTDHSFEEKDELRMSQEALNLQQEILKTHLDSESYTNSEIKKLITDYILNEFISKNKIISNQIIDELANNYNIDRNVVIQIINEIISHLKLERKMVFELEDNIFDESAQKIFEDEEKLRILINDQYIAKKKLINSNIIDDIARNNSVSRHLVILVIENIITARGLRRDSIVTADVFDVEVLVEKDKKETVAEAKQGQAEETIQSRKPVSTDEQSNVTFDTAKSFSPSPELKSSSLYKPERPEPHIDEEINISESKRTEIEALMLDDYINRGIKITESVLEQIVIRTALPKYIIIEIVEEIIIKKGLSREMIANLSIFHDEDYSDSQQNLECKDKAVLETTERKSSGYSTPEARHYDDGLDKSISYSDYESPFHKAFIGGMTEIRTTHITTLSGKSTPEFGPRDGTPDSSSEIISRVTSTITNVTEKAEKADDQDRFGDFGQSKISEGKEQLKKNLDEIHDDLQKKEKEAFKSGTISSLVTDSIETTKQFIDQESLSSKISSDKVLHKVTDVSVDTLINLAKASNEEEKLISLESQSLVDLDDTIGKGGEHSKQQEGGVKTSIDSDFIKQMEETSQQFTSFQSSSSLLKDFVTDEKIISKKSTSEVSSLSKDVTHGDSTGKSTSDVSMSPLIRDGSMIQSHLSGRSTPDKRSDNRSRTATPEGFRSGDVIRTIITTTRTMSDDGEIITTTREVTEATNEKGETVVLTEKTDVQVDDKLPENLIGEVKPFDVPGSEITDKDADLTSPRSDLSSGHSRAATHIWGSSEERHTYSDEEQSSPPLFSSPYPSEHAEDESSAKVKDQSKSETMSSAAMSSSFYGELPSETAHFSSSLTGVSDTSSFPEQDEFSFKKFTVEKEYAGGYEDKGSKKLVDEADLDFEKALTGLEREKADVKGGLALEKSSFSQELEKSSSSHPDDKKKDPLAGWGSPLGLPSPKAPRKFNLRSPIQACSSADLSPDSLNFDVINDWGEPMRLPSPAPATNEVSNKGSPGTPKKEKKQAKKVISENLKNKKRSESPNKNEKKLKDSKNKVQPVYLDLAYVAHHGNSFYTALEFFKKIRARYYVFSGTEPSREVYDALLEAKKTWEDKELEVTMIPTYDTDTLGYWVADNEEALAAHHIDLSPSASRCTINLQDHETSCSAYRLEF